MNIFEDAQALAKANKETFEAPSKTELKNIKRDSHVKVCTGKERFWVLVTEVSGNVINGIVDNDLIFTSTHGLSCGDSIQVTKDNVYQAINY